MKSNIIKFIAAGVLAAGAGALTGCQDHFDEWNLSAPVAENKANISIIDFKKEFWQESDNFCVEIPAREDGSHYYISGRVISSDEQGNVFKSLYIQDETGVMPLSINQYSLYINNRIGQEIVLDLTGLYCGRYAGLFQIGAISYDEKTGDAGTTFMAPEIFNLHREYNGNPEPAKVDTILVEDLSTMAGDLQKWQGQMVRFNNVTFTNANNPENNQLCDEYHSSGYSQNITGSFGEVAIRTSGYSTFWNSKLPTQACDVAGILSYYNGNWQVILNDIEGIMNIGDPTAEGIKTKPYTVDRAIELSTADNTVGWVKGYIVGTIQPEITTITSNADIQWVGEEPFIMDNYLVIASSPEVRDYTKCLLVPITAGSALYTYGNLADHPELAGRTLNIRGRFSRDMGMAYLAANDGSAPTFEIEGVYVPGSDDEGEDGGDAAEGDGTEASPYNVSQAIAKVGSGTAWVKGYIVGAMNSNNNYTFEAAAPFAIASNVYIADSQSETNTDKMVPVQLVAGSSIRSAVNLMDNPGNLGKVLSIEGELINYFSQPGLKNPTNYKLDGQGSEGGDTPNPPAAGSGSGTETDPYDVTSAIAKVGSGAAWVKGYIVGAMNSNNNYTFEAVAPFAIASNVYLAASATETSTDKMLPVQLVAGTDIRSAVNLMDNPGNLGKVLTIQGELTNYFSQPGLKSPTAYKLDGQGSGGGDTPTPPATGGTESEPYSVGDVLGLNNPGTTSWVEGYIVGSSNSSSGAFQPNLSADGNAASNILLAASATETDPSKMVPVQLVINTSIRAALNLVDNPGNLGKKVKIEGTLTSYFNRTGVKAPSNYTLL